MYQMFEFNGRSRPTRLVLSKDRQPTKDVILARARGERQLRGKGKRDCEAATSIQKSARRLLARGALAKLAGAALKELEEADNVSAECGGSLGVGRTLESLCWLYEFVRRGAIHTLVGEGWLHLSSKVLLNRLSSVVRFRALKGQLIGCPRAIRLLLQLAFEAYLSPPCDEENVGEQREYYICLLVELFGVAKELVDGASILVCALDLFLRHGVAHEKAFVTLLSGLYATLSPAAVEAEVQSPACRAALTYAIGSCCSGPPYLPPTTCALSVLLGITCSSGGPQINEEANAMFLEAIVDTTTEMLRGMLTSSPIQMLGKLVRFIEYFYYCENEGLQKRNLRRKWIGCLSRLTLLCCAGDELILETLKDFDLPRASGGSEQRNHRQLTTYLFSEGYGLRLLEQGLRMSLLAPSVDALADVNLLCGVFIWPLYKFATTSANGRLESTAIVSRLVHFPNLLQCLWETYGKCHGDVFQNLAGKSVAELVEVGAPGWLYSLNCHADPPAEVLRSVSLSVPTRGVFYDPYPAVSVMLFSLMSYFVDTAGFVEGLEQGTVVNRTDTVMLVLVLKGIVHRSFFYGVLPYGKCEVVTHEALTLFSKLHVVDEAEPFTPNSSVWLSCCDHLLLKAFDDIKYGTWLSIVSNDSELDLVEHGDEHGSGVWTDSLSAEGAESYICLPLWKGSCTWSQEERCIQILQHAPFAVPFRVRVAILTKFLLRQGGRHHPVSWGHFVVRRGRAFADAFDRFADDPNSGDMAFVRFRDANDIMEEGYGQGVYREFLISVCKEGFAVEHGLFCLTDDGFVYPNPFSMEITGDPRHLDRIRFLGAMVGRALRDGVLQDIPFALHFRNAILGRNNSINVLKHFDSVLCRHLVSLTNLSAEEIEGLGLNFTYTVDVLGTVGEVELRPGGRNIAVTRDNYLNYIYLMANYKLNRESARQAKAFRNGLESVVHQSWLRLFDCNELMKLFGGDVEGSIDVVDWRRSTQYHAPDDASSKPIEVFWEVVESLPLEQQRKLLKFSTSMNRPPLLGFQSLNPPFKVHVLWNEKEERLPSASTCLCTLKLPPYQTFEIALQKITTAIEETNNFGFS